MDISGRFQINALVLAAFCLMGLGAVCGYAQSDTQAFIRDSLIFGHAKWRSNWLCRLTTVPPHPVIPDTVIVMIKNQSRDTLRGSSPFFSLYEVDVYHASDRLASVAGFVLAPGDSMLFRHNFRALAMSGYRHLPPLDTAKVFEAMRTNPWSMRAGFTDNHSPKPLTESNLIVYSNLIECNVPATK